MMGPAVAFVGGSGAWQGFGTIRRAATAAKVPLVWRASEGSEGLAAVPVGGGGAWQGFEPTRRATSAAKVPQMWRAPEGPEGTGGLRDRPLRAAGSRVAISRAAGPDGARNTRGTTSNKSRKAAVCRHAKQPGHEVGLTARSGGTRNTRGTAHRRQNSGGTPREQGRQVDAPAARQLGGLGAA